MKILAFCFFPAFVPIANGGQSRLFNFYRALSKNYNITLITSTHIGQQEEVVRHGVNFIERRIPKDNFFIENWGKLEKFSGGGDLSAPTIAACASYPTLLHRAYLEEYEDADIIFHDFPFMIGYDIFAGLDDKPRVYNAHNCESLLYRELHPGKKSKIIHNIVQSSEERILRLADLVLYCNEDDLEFFYLLEPESRFESLYVPNGMTPLDLQISQKKNKNHCFNAVFMGSGHPPNVDAANFIVNELAKKLPDIYFHFIGSCLEESDYALNVIRHGVVDENEKKRLLAHADIALNPMKNGSGSNVKVLDYFSYGIPVLSSVFGMRGINALPNIHFIEASIDQFDSALRNALNFKEKLYVIGEAGKEFALQNYTWDAIVKPVPGYLNRIVNEKKQKKSKFVLALNDYDSFAGIGGGGTRTRGLYDAVSNWCPVIFICFSDDGKIGSRSYKNKINVINIPKTIEHVFETESINSQFHISANDIVVSRHATKNFWLTNVYRVLRRLARIVVIEHCYLVDLPFAFKDRFVYSSHNNEIELKGKLLEWHPLKNELLNEVKRVEKLAVENSAITIAVSYEDALSLMKNKVSSGPVIIVRNGAEPIERNGLFFQELKKIKNKINKPAVVFMGSAHMPNVESAQFIVKELASKNSDINFNFIGSVCDSIQNPPINVICWGIVDDVMKNAILESCDLALNPMFSGSGSNVKLADYIGNGLFVVTTKFGIRGYPSSVNEHIAIASESDFSVVLKLKLEDPCVSEPKAKEERRLFFEKELSMKSIANSFVSSLKRIESSKKRILYVAYRYTYPPLGGAEVNIEKFIRALDESDKYSIDVVAPEISGIHNQMRFSESYSFDSNLSAPVGLLNVRFARFPINTPSVDLINSHLLNAWSTQPRLELFLNKKLQDNYDISGLTWGWSYPEGKKPHIMRWAFTECGIFLNTASIIVLEGFVNDSVVITIYNNENIITGPTVIDGHFSLSFKSPPGEVCLISSAQKINTDPRPLAMRISKIMLNNKELDLSKPTLLESCLSILPPSESFQLFHEAANSTRTLNDICLAYNRGPWSDGLESYIKEHVNDYDLVITHNHIFRPAAIAIEEAKRKNIPSILIPHAHLDDDFYHFPDFLKVACNATLVLAAPRKACDFLAEQGCNVRYMPAGCDVSESFVENDVSDFYKAYKSNRPFLLVLGRKSGSKGYIQIIDAIQRINEEGIDLQAVLIGPDDDGVLIDDANVVYLGRQSRSVVRGALMECSALCNMSVSESFGIVLLEAWMAGKAVIVNESCAAFHDMAIDNVNALFANFHTLKDKIKMLLSNPLMAKELASNGMKQVHKFDWNIVNNKFLNEVNNILENLEY